MPLCFVSIGSNVERERNVRGALRALREAFGPLLVSSVYESDAVGFNGARFYNLVVACHTDSLVDAMIQTLDDVESAHGRLHNEERFAPRTLDLDLLAYGDAVIQRPELKLPRPDIRQFSFVLQPLAEIAPDLALPGTTQTYLSLWRDFPLAQAASRVSFDPIGC